MGITCIRPVSTYSCYPAHKNNRSQNMGKRGGGVKRVVNSPFGSHKQLSLREEKSGKKQTNSINVKSKLKLEHLQNVAVWASGKASVPSLAAFFGHRLAATNETLGLQPDPSLFSCQRCETVLRPGFNCTIRIEKNQVKAGCRSKKRKAPTQNNVVYTCHFCSHLNIIRGTPKGYVKDLYPPREKQKLPPKSEHVNSCLEETGKLNEEDRRSNDEVVKADEITMAGIAEDSLGSNSPITPVVRTKITLDANKRKKNQSGTKKPAEGESGSAKTDAGKAVSGSNKRKRKSWTTLREIAERSELDNSPNIANLPVPFFLSS